MFFWTTSLSRSFGIVISVSTLALSSSAAFSATSLRLAPSKLNGLVTTPIVSAPGSLAISATIGRRAGAGAAAEAGGDEHHVRVGEGLRRSSPSPPRPRAGRSSVSPPAPRPRVILSPIRILCGASDCRSACASVLQAMNSTPIISARIIRLTALLPPPPTPMTRISAKFSESERNGIGFSSGDPRRVLGGVISVSVGWWRARDGPTAGRRDGSAGPGSIEQGARGPPSGNRASWHGPRCGRCGRSTTSEGVGG